MPKSTRRNSPIRIMFVDDEKDILSTVKRGLESNNTFIVETFSSGESALQAFEINKEEFNKVMPSVNVIDFISKPLSISSLITKLKSMLKNYPESPATL